MTKTTSPAAGSVSSQPNLAVKPRENVTAIAQSSTVALSSIGPTKNWVIPPRPKPGRKPSTDAPPTKRKAQNRAAQRAFRERRAARVGELEDQLKETEEERQKRESAMHDQLVRQSDDISRLEHDVRRLSEEVTTWRDQYSELQQSFEDQRNEKDEALVQLAYVRNGSRATGTNAVPLPPRRRQSLRNAQSSAPPLDASITILASEALGCGGCTSTSSCSCVETAIRVAASGCGKCTPESRCECLDETLNGLGMNGSTETDLKRSLSTGLDSGNVKRLRFSVDEPQIEIDFTTQFSQTRPLIKQKPSQENTISLDPRIPTDSCGFCAEGTFCACAEAAGGLSRNLELEDENRLAPLLNEFTPPPSETDVMSPDNNSSKITPLHPNHRIHHQVQPRFGDTPFIPKLHNASARTFKPAQGPCSGDPGSCKQCQEDPKSGLFCRSLAAMRASDEPSIIISEKCCSGSSIAEEGCCKRSEDSLAVRLSCSETYKTLASHKNFEQASDALSDWLPKLHTSLPRYPGRAPLDIEAASVMNVIKYFDVRFGRNQLL